MSQNSVDVSEIHWLMDMLQTVDVGLVVLSADYRIQVWNGFMENHSGLTPRQVRDRYLFDLFSEIDEDWLRRKCDPVILLKNRAFTIWEQRPYIFKFRNYRPITGSAEYMYQNSTIFPLSDTMGKVTHLCLIIYDVTDVAVSRLELESMNGQLRTLSKTDFLTNLNNRGFWEEALINEYKRIKRSGHHSTLLMCDIDHFKRVNDTYGHAAGDAVIQQVAVAVKKNLRSTDVAGRYGGEEFAVLLLDTTVDQAMFFAERLRKNVEAMAVEFNQQVLRVTVSIGLAEFHQEMDEYRDWIEAADKALYQSKAAGRNCITKAEK
ncbi:MAG: sensor domain-containing diguanylate cyclase [Gammaproteobacteria bacterium]|nr:sensor domain-containing diguanylate cyclase [Gammaproteobacteria bacterium]MBU2177084.1 sensor domain-containing diguanylate cyclase [Gammaproteobacteria bacterium]MBU2247070.1 sensor domain-containing diguanylate cyclase [Gammaproteobacteria bacterium]MBU2393524.1 sensor domain-containing diguanylate cyclase [Gammaproteobacteria bacterium]MBU2682443.1 sensor domain-containing diguanylate cyclase [Gammaproteobacteria bacterium]